ncbi:hypothetical protein TSUD_346660 [Trifolium subterraneum]|nr:hypothetical protein TSUD_346660 [Trifolium subterraneum]
MATYHVGLHEIGIIFLLQMIAISVKPLSFNYQQGFKYDDVKLQGDASLMYSYIQLTSTSRYQSNAYSVGRVTCFEPLQIWDKASRKLTDFTTQFSFVIYSNETDFGDGLTFFFADPELPLYYHIRQGGGLGLVDDYHIANSTRYSFLAVEFDTYHNSWDPSGTHVGINFNSMISKINKPWFIDIRSKKIYNCKIEYNSSTHILNVSFTGNITNGMPSRNYISYNVDLRDYLPEKVIVGFSAATGYMFEMNTLNSWSFNSSLKIHDEKNHSTIPTNPSPSPIPNVKISPKIDSERGTSSIWVELGVGVAIAASFLILGGLYRLGRLLEVVDTKLEGVFDDEQMERLVVIGLWCANPNYSFRPSVRQVIQVLKLEAPLPILPSPTKSTTIGHVSSASPRRLTLHNQQE